MCRLQDWVTLPKQTFTLNISPESSQNLKYLRNDFDEASQKESLPTLDL